MTPLALFNKSLLAQGVASVLMAMMFVMMSLNPVIPGQAYSKPEL